MTTLLRTITCIQASLSCSTCRRLSALMSGMESETKIVGPHFTQQPPAFRFRAPLAVQSARAMSSTLTTPREAAWAIFVAPDDAAFAPPVMRGMTKAGQHHAPTIAGIDRIIVKTEMQNAFFSEGPSSPSATGAVLMEPVSGSYIGGEVGARQTGRLRAAQRINYCTTGGPDRARAVESARCSLLCMPCQLLLPHRPQEQQVNFRGGLARVLQVFCEGLEQARREKGELIMSDCLTEFSALV
jgi:hypothetical protein